MQINHGSTDSFWRCPSCQQTLEWHNNAWRCDNKHSFDRAKEGYVNLLLAQQKSSKDPGDNKDMVAARRAFLEQDHYLPLAEKMAGLILANQADYPDALSPRLSIYDAGCGEGYYLAKIKKHLAKAGRSVVASGSDIAKPAIQKAAKKYPDIHYAVASSFNLPVASDSQDAVLQVFAPSSPSEIQRILKLDGLWLRVTPASHHLFELKQFVYAQAETHELNSKIPEGFELLALSHVQFKMGLTTPQQRESLLMMTPFFWTISEEKKHILLLDLTTVNGDFDITLMQKKTEC
jgi:23S rRNA (guanine745-N1)-methyltransferase